MRPHEDNILYDIPGSDFFLYDLSQPGQTPKTDKVRKVQYNLRYIDRKHYNAVVKMFINKTANGVRRRFKSNWV